jgi:hypothetical protein
MTMLAALAAGLLFGLGLAVSQMADPAKVLGFLDLGGAWDPTLAAVMGGALIVTIPGYRLVMRAARPVLSDHFGVPPRGRVDGRLIAGAAIFGVGWGLVGLCPGPAIASLAYAMGESVWFLAAMAVGMLVTRRLFP